ncbi:MAG: phenylalanine--tRNA ligase subunit beta [SAR202 cluster bacterium]|jgi:phenylalanyl-tRNA synthetase beta chain|nr:phenylalanine--tRNA ligase subunit beta [SAR202 cluster bacterium]MQG57979.1 phenylalanine--tRNA ligase subunit beta [SAR202 cluster bacterium]MQG69048.1 phenylalanine--tRNA ligase subunit beta [SAR202 cluster bacterium]|tara:strand:- start:17267 stop:19747 length:2481 start_codon:yes stop_codon:yes gene_type:complete
MLVPISWLKNYVPITDLPKELAHRLTMAGVEVGDVEQIGADWDRDKVIVGHVLEVNPHPNADRLSLPTVDLGDGETATVVCGAPNVAAGQKIAFAKEGARLFSPRSGGVEELKRAKIRGVESAGMVCSRMELGMGEDHDGILVLDAAAAVGTPLVDLLGDAILDVEVTPNRPDCLSVLGIAHEVAALTGQPATEPDISYPEDGPAIEGQIKIEVADPNLCYRYTASLVTSITIGPSPEWMQQALVKAGQRPINNIVDITNFVMLEYGQPLHAFDYDKVNDKTVIVRAAREGEVFETLDGESRRLEPPMLTIADAHDAVGLAGVMGGSNSEMTEQTTSVLLESANFSPINTRRTRTMLGMNTEASYRFERGIRAALAPLALRRATKLILDLCGGQAASGIVDLYPTDREPSPVKISRSRVRQVLGVDYPMPQIERVLASLGFETAEPPGGLIDLIEAVEAGPVAERSDTLWLKPPYWRSDITIEDDLVEEVARIVGYDTIPTTMLSTAIPHWEPQPMTEFKDAVKDLMASAGLQETISYSLTTLDRLASVDAVDDSNPPIRMANPMSVEWEYLRTSLRSSVLMTLASNRRMAQSDGIRIFEVGRIYAPQDEAKERDLPDEKEMLVGVLSGPRFSTSWTAEEAEMGFFDAKGALEYMFGRLGVDVVYEPADDSVLHPGRTAVMLAGKTRLGVVGEVRADVLDRFELDGYPVALFEIDMETLLSVASAVDLTYRAASRFPESYRDLALVVDSEVSSARIQQIIDRHRLVIGSTPFDVYEGEGVPDGKKSVAFRVVFQSDRSTLTSEEVDKFQGDIVRQLGRQLGAELRG